MMRVKEQTLSLDSEHVVNAKEENNKLRKKAVPAVAVISVNKSAQQKKRAKMLEISDDDAENAAPPKVLKSTVIQSTRI